MSRDSWKSISLLKDGVATPNVIAKISVNIADHFRIFHHWILTRWFIVHALVQDRRGCIRLALVPISLCFFQQSSHRLRILRGLPRKGGIVLIVTHMRSNKSKIFFINLKSLYLYQCFSLNSKGGGSVGKEKLVIVSCATSNISLNLKSAGPNEWALQLD